MAATLTTQSVYMRFWVRGIQNIFHGHSYTGNQLGAAVAWASWELLHQPKAKVRRKSMERVLARVGFLVGVGRGG